MPPLALLKPSLLRLHDLLGHRGTLAQTPIGDPLPSGAAYADPYADAPGFPVLPFQIFALDYDLDLVVVTRHPHWVMHEFARVGTPAGEVWLAKEADPSGTQTVVAHDPTRFAPEIDVPRLKRPIQVDDQSTTGRVDLHLSYLNCQEQEVEVHFRGDPPSKAPPLRNGNTMGHSQSALAAVLDIHAQGLGRQVQVWIDHKPIALHRLGGILPFAFTLKQTQAGFSQAAFSQKPASGGFFVDRRDFSVETWQIHEQSDTIVAKRTGGLTQLRYAFRREGGHVELFEADVYQFSRPHPLLKLRLFPALPDLRRRFMGTHTSRFILDVNGQSGYAYGQIEATSQPEGPVIFIRPLAPRWMANRPLRTHLHFEQGTARTTSRRVQGVHGCL